MINDDIWKTLNTSNQKYLFIILMFNIGNVIFILYPITIIDFLTKLSINVKLLVFMLYNCIFVTMLRVANCFNLTRMIV